MQIDMLVDFFMNIWKNQTVLKNLSKKSIYQIF